MKDIRKLVPARLAVGLAGVALAAMLTGAGCGRKQAAGPPASPAASMPQSQKTMSEYIQSNPGMPAQEKAALQRQMNKSGGR